MADDTNNETADTILRLDLLWDDEVRGLCVRVYRNGSEAFIFVYRKDNHQRFIRIGKTPVWSREAARRRAKELRSIVDQGRDPMKYHRERDKVWPVENVMQLIAQDVGRTSPE